MFDLYCICCLLVSRSSVCTVSYHSEKGPIVGDLQVAALYTYVYLYVYTEYAEKHIKYINRVADL